MVLMLTWNRIYLKSDIFAHDDPDEIARSLSGRPSKLKAQSLAVLVCCEADFRPRETMILGRRLRT